MIRRLHHLPTTLSVAPRHLNRPNDYLFDEKLANDHLSWLCNHNLHHEALRAFDSLQSHSPRFRLAPATYRHLFLACTHLNSAPACRRVHRHLSRSGARPDVVLCNHILNAYGKCGSLQDARRLFDEMLERNSVSWTSMIAALARSGCGREAVEMYVDMLDSGSLPDKFALGSVMRTCAGMGDSELGRQLHCHAVKWEYASDQLVQNALVSLYAKCDLLEDADVVFSRIREKNLVSWGAMISGFTRQGRKLDALVCFRQMLRTGSYSPNGFVFGSVFHACSGLSELKYCEQMLCLCIKFGKETDCFAGCSLSEMYSELGHLDSAWKAFDGISSPDLVAWNSIISSLAGAGHPEDAMVLFSDMRNSHLEPDELTVRHLLCGFTSPAWVHHGRGLHAYIVNTGFNADVSVCNTLLTMYSRCSDYPTTCYFFEEMNGNRDLVSWNIILMTCLWNAKHDEVSYLLKVVSTTDIKPDHIMLNIVLSSCAEVACLQKAEQVHTHSCKTGLESDILVANSLIDAYSKCGSLDDAYKIFQLVGDIRDVVSWSSLIVGYAHSGRGQEAIELFINMQRLGIMPNHVTYVGVLSACSHIGLVDIGSVFFETMQREHGIVPSREHYSCVVDMLSRAGRLTEAMQLVEKIPFKPDVVVWKTILTACKLRGNMGIGERAAEEILKLDPSNSAAKSLLCNIYSSAGYWDGVARIRRMMRDDGLQKDPGKSWIEVEGKIHDFVAGDTRHPGAEVINALMDLRLKMEDPM